MLQVITHYALYPIIKEVFNLDQYYCYSPRLMKFLTDQGIMFNRVGTHFTTGKTFFTYNKTKELEVALTQFTKEKQQALNK